MNTHADPATRDEQRVDLVPPSPKPSVCERCKRTKAATGKRLRIDWSPQRALWLCAWCFFEAAP